MQFDSGTCCQTPTVERIDKVPPDATQSPKPHAAQHPNIAGLECRPLLGHRLPPAQASTVMQLMDMASDHGNLQSDMVSLQWRQEFSEVQRDIVSKLQTLISQQQDFKETLSEMASDVKSASEKQNAINKDIIKEIRNFRLPFAIAPSGSSPPAHVTFSTSGTSDRVRASPTDERRIEDAGEASESTTVVVVQDRSFSYQQDGSSPQSYGKRLASSIILNGAGKMKTTSTKSVTNISADELATESWMSLLRGVLQSENFELFTAGLIVANAAALSVDAQYHGLQVGFDLQYKGCDAAAHDAWPGAKSVLHVVDWVFGAIFFLEAVIKILCYRCDYFVGGCLAVWNWLDLLCVLAFVVDKTFGFVLPLDPLALRLLRLLRLVRLVRLIRTLEALDVLYIMATAIRGMAGVVGWAVVLLSVMLMTCALFLTSILQSSHFQDASAAGMSDDPKELEAYREVYEYFGTFTRSTLSMFELALGNWPPVVRLLSEHVSESFMLFGVLHKLSIGFAVIGVISGVIMQETFKVAATDDVIMVRQKKRAAQIGQKKMEVLFEALDYSGDGVLDFQEFEKIASDKEVKTWLASMDIETDDLRALFALIDFDNNGVISIEELVSRVPRIRGAARSLDVLTLRKQLDAIGHALLILSHGEKVREDSLSSVPLNGLGGIYNPIPRADSMSSIRALGGNRNSGND